MSYHTRKVVRPAAKKVNGLPLALLRLMSQLEDTHASDVTISAPNEMRNGCQFQLGLWAAPGASLQIGDPGSKESVSVEVADGKTTVSITGSGGIKQTVTAPFSDTVIGDCEVPFHHIFISVYANRRTFGIAVGDETHQVANQAFNTKANYVHINGKKLHYNENCFGVQLWCNKIQFKSVEYLDLKNYSFSPWERVIQACTFGEVWEEWTCSGPASGHNDWPSVKHNSGLTWMQPVASSRLPDRRSHKDNAFHWVRPEGVRSVHLWLCQAGGGGKGGSKHATGANGANGASKMFRVDQSELTLHVFPGGAGGKGNKYGSGHPGEPGRPTTVDRPAWTSEGGDPAMISQAIGLKNFIIAVPGYISWGVTGSSGVKFGRYPYAIKLINVWRYCAGGKGGKKDSKYPGKGEDGGTGLALFHYTY